MRRKILLSLFLALPPALAVVDNAPASFATPKDAARFLRDRLGVGNANGPIAAVGRSLAEQLARGFGPGVDQTREPLDDGLDDSAPATGALQRSPDAALGTPSQRALEELRLAYETGVVQRTVRRTLDRLAKDEANTSIGVRVAILRSRTDRAEYHSLVESLSRDILTAATAELIENRGSTGVTAPPGIAAREPSVDRAPAEAAFSLPDDDGADLPSWPWLLGAAAAAVGLTLHQALRLTRRYRGNTGGIPAGGLDDDARFDSITEVRPVRPSVHQTPPER